MVLATTTIADMHLVGAGASCQCFPFYVYDEDGNNRRENITDWARKHFRNHYKNNRISKWDIFYYVWLWIFLGWPPSLLTWDVLFLIPVPWIGPVLAPIIVSVALIVGSLLALRVKRQGTRLTLPAPLWLLGSAGGGLVLLSFTLDYRAVLAQMEPSAFRWWLFATGVACATAAVTLGMSRLTKGGGTRQEPVV